MPKRRFLATMRQAELSELEIAPLRGQICGAQRDAGIDVAVALGEEIEDAHQLVAIDGVIILLPLAARRRRRFSPCLAGEATIFGKPGLAEHVGEKRYRPLECSVVVCHLASKQIAGEP